MFDTGKTLDGTDDLHLGEMLDIAEYLLEEQQIKIAMLEAVGSAVKEVVEKYLDPKHSVEIRTKIILNITESLGAEMAGICFKAICEAERGKVESKN